MNQENQPDNEPALTFERYLLLMSTQALIAMGAAENPLTGKKEENLDGAKWTIDVLTMLEDKTKGNLTDDEQDTLNKVLYELRTRFVEALDAGKQTGE